MKKIVVLTGAGVSAESGIPTFRDADGLWEGHDVMEVASPMGWLRNPELVQNFYNERRKAMLDASPNEGHKLISALEEHFEVVVVTQNVDDLHERAGSSKVVHLHGSLRESRSLLDGEVYPIEGWELKMDDLCPNGGKLRPNIVWFGEPVPMMEKAVEEAGTADVFVVVGTSLEVYPAAGLGDYIPEGTPVYVIDPKKPSKAWSSRVHYILKGGSEGMKDLAEELKTLV
ncbi:MAG: NAD-dependent deacylase [Cytophagales bacterium]|nr:NAD-dependent deacylase [Cytophagales bacterium]